MASVATHAAHAVEYRSVAETLCIHSPASAGEIMWLAAVQAAQAVGHRQSLAGHIQSRNGIRNVIGRLPVSNNERGRLLDIANLTATNLHGLAYRPDEIDEPKHRYEIILAKDLVTSLLRYA